MNEEEAQKGTEDVVKEMGESKYVKERRNGRKYEK
jgi:hypothetical protein